MARNADKILNLLITDVRRRLIIESTPRIIQCIEALSDEEIWYKHNDNTNAVGNLVLHLCGNVRQYLLSGIGRQKDVRERSKEFSEEGPIEKKYLIQWLQSLMEEVDELLGSIKVTDLIQDRKVQGFDENVVSILVHVTEHFSYHTGQITYYTKFIKDVDTAYYGDLDLDVTG